jgi:hypothetical protein
MGSGAAGFPVNGGIVQWLTGGALFPLLDRICGPVGTLLARADVLRRLADQLDGPREQQNQARQRFCAVMGGPFQQALERNLSELDECYRRSGDDVRNLADRVTEWAELLENAQSTYNRVVGQGNTQAQAELNIQPPWVGKAIAILTALQTVYEIIQLVTGLEQKFEELTGNVEGSDIAATSQTAAMAGVAAPAAGGGYAGGGYANGGYSPYGSSYGYPATTGTTWPVNGSADPNVYNSGWIPVEPSSQGVVVEVTKDGVTVHSQTDVVLDIEATIGGVKVAEHLEIDGDGDGKVVAD